MHFDELRFPYLYIYKIAGSLPEAPGDTCLLITQAVQLKAACDTIYRLGQRFHSLMMLMLPFMARNLFFCTCIFVVACSQ